MGTAKVSGHLEGFGKERGQGSKEAPDRDQGLRNGPIRNPKHLARFETERKGVKRRERH